MMPYLDLSTCTKVTCTHEAYAEHARCLGGDTTLFLQESADFAGYLECAVHHSIRAGMDDPARLPWPAGRESIKTTSSASPIGVQSVRPTWFEDTTPRDTTSQQPQDPQKEQPQPLYGLELVIKEEVLPATDQPQFQSLELLAGRGLLASDTWKCKRAQVRQLLMSQCWYNHRGKW